MSAIHDFVSTNMTMFNFLYGQVFFITGLAIALQQRGLSNFRLARYLWLLASFGILHGIAEWGNLFIPIQNKYLSDNWMFVLHRLQDVAWALSFAFLLQFGINLIVPWLSWGRRTSWMILRLAPAWSVAITLIGTFIFKDDLGESIIRYYLGFPAAVLTAAALLGEGRNFRKFPSLSAKTNLTAAAAMFGIYSIMTGLVVKNHGMWPLQWLNYDNVFHATDLPIQFYRATVGLAIAFFVIRTLSIFDIEIKHRLEDSQRSEALLQDRQRIARDLHDGVVQSIYAAGLQLAVAKDELPDRRDRTAREMINRVTDQLESVISEIRGCIFKLGPAQAVREDISVYLQNLVNDFSCTCPIIADFSVKGTKRDLSSQQKENILMIARELLGNVAKHSLASRVELEIVYDDDGILFFLEDNGIGIDKRATGFRDFSNGKDGRGLVNISERVEAMGGKLCVSDGASGGTKVAFWISYTDRVKDRPLAMVSS